MAKAQSTEQKYEFVVGTYAEIGVFQHEALSAVAEGRYEDAVVKISEYQKRKAHVVMHKAKTERLFDHARELISAIKAKKTFPNLTSPPQSKQDEIQQKAHENWNDLKATLRRVKAIEAEISLQDARSSIWVIRALILSTMVILGCFIINEAFRSFGKSFSVVLDDMIKLIMSELF
ncbi:MAG: hypothetical protein SGI74_12300 [Oligoflexia bacterium]|nr:hypothetical protein [Oligoflexia bacterium]